MVIGIETDRGPWVQALIAAGYVVFAINPMQVARYGERHSTSWAKSDAGDAHVLAEIVRLDREHHRPVAGDSPEAEAVKLLARTHQSIIWDRPATCCGCAVRCGSSSRRRCRPSTICPQPDTLELLGSGARPRPRGPAVPLTAGRGAAPGEPTEP